MVPTSPSNAVLRCSPHDRILKAAHLSIVILSTSPALVYRPVVLSNCPEDEMWGVADGRAEESRSFGLLPLLSFQGSLHCSSGAIWGCIFGGASPDLEVASMVHADRHHCWFARSRRLHLQNPHDEQSPSRRIYHNAVPANYSTEFSCTGALVPEFFCLLLAYFLVWCFNDAHMHWHHSKNGMEYCCHISLSCIACTSVC